MWSDSLYEIYSDSEEENKSSVSIGDKAYLTFIEYSHYTQISPVSELAPESEGNGFGRCDYS